MSDLINTTRAIQRFLKLKVDGVYGPRTAAAVREALVGNPEGSGPVPVRDDSDLDARSLKVIDTLDAKARPMAKQYLRLAKATAATLGCDYILISGNRSWEEQAALYAQGRTAPGQIVTNAKAGFSNHNFGIAFDAGVFEGKVYLDGGRTEQAARAMRVHKACSAHAAACGLEWGGDWKGFPDLPHYEVKTGLSMAQKRAAMKARGTVL